MIRVLVVDDHDFVRAMVAGFLSSAGGIEVIGECVDGHSVVDTVAALRPDVVLMDVQMPGRTGIDATRDLIAVDPHARVLMLTGSANRRWRDEAVGAGAVGYLTKSGNPEVLVNAVRRVAAGGTVWS